MGVVRAEPRGACAGARRRSAWRSRRGEWQSIAAVVLILGCLTTACAAGVTPDQESLDDGSADDAGRLAIPTRSIGHPPRRSAARREALLGRRRGDLLPSRTMGRAGRMREPGLRLRGLPGRLQARRDAVFRQWRGDLQRERSLGRTHSMRERGLRVGGMLGRVHARRDAVFRQWRRDLHRERWLGCTDRVPAHVHQRRLPVVSSPCR